MTKYLISPGGAYSSDTIWSTSSGGANDTTHPTSSDDVICDAASGNVTLTFDQAYNGCKTFDSTNFSGTITNTKDNGLYVAGNVIIGASVTYSPYVNPGGPGLQIASTATLKTNGKILAAGLRLAGTVTLLDNLTVSGPYGLRFYTGTYNSGNYNINTSSFISNYTVAVTLTLGSSQITCTSLDLSGTNLTVTSNTAEFIVNQGATGTMLFSHGNVVFDKLTLNGYNDKLSQKLFARNLTVTNQLKLAGQSATNRFLIRSDTIGTRRTISAGSVVLENVDFQDITFSGSATWEGTSVGDAQGNSGTITYTTPVEAKWRKSGGTGNWSDPTSWDTGVVPLCHDNVRFDADSILASGKTITADMPRLGKDISFEGCLNSPVLAISQASYIFGAPTFISGMTFSGATQSLYFESRSNFNFTSGLIFIHNLVINCFGATCLFLDNFLSSAINTGNLSLLAGTINFNNKNTEFAKVTQNGSIARSVIMGSGVLTIKNFGATTSAIWRMETSTGFTITPNSSTININNTGVTANKQFDGNGLTYNNLKFSGAGNPCVITGNNTFNQLESDTTAGANTITLTAGSIQTVQSLIMVGSAGKKITLNSSIPGTKAKIKVTNECYLQYCDLTDIEIDSTSNGIVYIDSNSTQTNCTNVWQWDNKILNINKQYII